MELLFTSMSNFMPNMQVPIEKIYETLIALERKLQPSSKLCLNEVPIIHDYEKTLEESFEIMGFSGQEPEKAGKLLDVFSIFEEYKPLHSDDNQKTILSIITKTNNQRELFFSTINEFKNLLNLSSQPSTLELTSVKDAIKHGFRCLQIAKETNLHDFDLVVLESSLQTLNFMYESVSQDSFYVMKSI